MENIPDEIIEEAFKENQEELPDEPLMKENSGAPAAEETGAHGEGAIPLMNEAIPLTARKATVGGRMNLLRKTKAKFSGRVSCRYSADAPLISDAHSSTELDHQIKGSPRDMPKVGNLLFADAYMDDARSSVLVSIR